MIVVAALSLLGLWVNNYLVCSLRVLVPVGVLSSSNSHFTQLHLRLETVDHLAGISSSAYLPPFAYHR